MKFRPFPQPPLSDLDEPHSRSYAATRFHHSRPVCVVRWPHLTACLYYLLEPPITIYHESIRFHQVQIHQHHKALSPGTQRSSQANTTPTLLLLLKPTPTFPGKYISIMHRRAAALISIQLNSLRPQQPSRSTRRSSSPSCFTPSTREEPFA